MRYIISGKNLDITEGLRSAVTDKLGKLERYFTPLLSCYLDYTILHIISQ